jgi:hypothetical protein
MSFECMMYSPEFKDPKLNRKNKTKDCNVTPEIFDQGLRK